MKRTVAEKMGLREGMRSYILDAPRSAVESMSLPRLRLVKMLRGKFEYLHLFVKLQDDLNTNFPRLACHLGKSGMLWVSWPKARQLETDLTLPHVIRIGYSHGLVESISLRIDDIWSGLKFTQPKVGKQYNNKYGQLPGAV
jgi:hypothetical protein